jgi:hypothetical protein
MRVRGDGAKAERFASGHGYAANAGAIAGQRCRARIHDRRAACDDVSFH